jgi:cysteine-rich repeat protein
MKLLLVAVGAALLMLPSGVLASILGPSSAMRHHRLVCGDGMVDPGEQCDDGDIIPGDGCDAACQLEFCGDGIGNGTMWRWK